MVPPSIHKGAFWNKEKEVLFEVDKTSSQKLWKIRTQQWYALHFYRKMNHIDRIILCSFLYPSVRNLSWSSWMVNMIFLYVGNLTCSVVRNLKKYKKTLHSHKIDLLDTKKEKKLNFKTDTLCPSFRYLNTNFLWELGFNLSWNEYTLKYLNGID